MSRDDHWIAPLHRAERFVTVSRLTCERTCDHECHYDPDMDPESCDGCTGMGEQERVATPRQTAADAADADTPEPLTAEGRKLLDGFGPMPRPDAQELHRRSAMGRRVKLAAAIVAIEQEAARAVPEPSGLREALEKIARPTAHGFPDPQNREALVRWMTATARAALSTERSDEGMG